jgi:hypothetical protein
VFRQYWFEHVLAASYSISGIAPRPSAMAYTDDAVLSKLSALNESHESIATTAQWIMFHR